MTTAVAWQSTAVVGKTAYTHQGHRFEAPVVWHGSPWESGVVEVATVRLWAITLNSVTCLLIWHLPYLRAPPGAPLRRPGLLFRIQRMPSPPFYSRSMSFFPFQHDADLHVLLRHL